MSRSSDLSGDPWNLGHASDLAASRARPARARPARARDQNMGRLPASRRRREHGCRTMPVYISIASVATKVGQNAESAIIFELKWPSRRNRHEKSYSRHGQ